MQLTLGASSSNEMRTGELANFCKRPCGTVGGLGRPAVGGIGKPRIRTLLTALALLVFGRVAFSQSSLPPEVQADLLRQQIIESAQAAAKSHDYAPVLAHIDEYKKLKVSVPPALFLVESKAAAKTGDFLRAKTALESFLSVADRSSASYKEALSLYHQYVDAAQPAIKAQEEKDRVKAAETHLLSEDIESKVKAAVDQCLNHREEQAAHDQCDKKRGKSYKACVAQFPQYFSYDNSGRSLAFDDCFRAIQPLCQNLAKLDPSDDVECTSINGHLRTQTSYSQP
jgi:hypothetical protein